MTQKPKPVSPSQPEVLKVPEDSRAPELEIRSTAIKDDEYYNKLHQIVFNQPFLQEVHERHLAYQVAMTQLSVQDPNLRDKYAEMQGQISCMRWILFELLKR